MKTQTARHSVWQPVLYTAVTIGCTYASAVGYEQLQCRSAGACPPDHALAQVIAFGVGAFAMLLTGVMHEGFTVTHLHEGQVVTSTTEPEQQPQVQEQPAPEGWRPIPRTTAASAAPVYGLTTSAEITRVWLTVGSRRIPMRMTQAQAEIITRHVRAGHSNIIFRLAVKYVMSETDIKAIRQDLLRKQLATIRGNGEVRLTDEAREAFAALPYR